MSTKGCRQRPCTYPAAAEPDGEVIHADDGHHHFGPEIAVPTSCRIHRDHPETVVRVVTQVLDALSARRIPRDGRLVGSSYAGLRRALSSVEWRLLY